MSETKDATTTTPAKEAMEISDEIRLHLKARTRFLYIVTNEEDRLLDKLSKILEKHILTTKVFNPSMGLLGLRELLQDYSTLRAHPEDAATIDRLSALRNIYRVAPKAREEQKFVILDPEPFFREPFLVRMLLNIQSQIHADETNMKTMIFIGHKLVPLGKMQRYVQVVYDEGMTTNEILGRMKKFEKICGPTPVGIEENFKGLTHWELNSAVAQSVIKTKNDSGEGPRHHINPRVISDFKRSQLNKTDLIQFVDTSGVTFDQLGGADNFKEWAKKTKACWTPEGRAFGLKPPKGVLSVGVWGCGKSLGIKALGSAWDLPVIQLETGKLRSSGVGESESNVYRSLALIESVGSCLVWIDEAEKTFSGTASSGASDAGTTSRMTGILSTWLQETTAQVCLAMTANSLKGLPTELINRMNERFFYDLPSEEERIEILKIHLKMRGQDPVNFKLVELAEVAATLVGREIEQAIEAALTESFCAGKPSLDNDILADQLKRKPRIFKTMADEMKEVLDWVGFDPELNDGIRARYASKHRSNTVKNRFAG